MKNRKSVTDKIEESILRCEASHRGGGIEIALDAFGFKGQRMAAYQNYLGGGLLGRICANDTLRRQSLHSQYSERTNKKLDKIAEELKRYFHNLTNHEGDQWEEETFEQNQLRKPVSAY